MKIGIFDSGLGGLLVARAITARLPQYDYVYLGDTARVPYGNRSQSTVYEFTEQAVAYLLAQGCKLVIIACNTASAEALRRIQQDYLPRYYPDRRVLGVLIPAAEAAVAETRQGNIGVLATSSTVASGAFIREIKKLAPAANITQQPAPLLVPLIENNGIKWVDPILREYLSPLQARGIDTLVLGCTHYPYLRSNIEGILPGVKVIAQDEIVPPKLADYLYHHPEIEALLSRSGERYYCVTDKTESFTQLAKELLNHDASLDVVSLEW